VRFLCLRRQRLFQSVRHHRQGPRPGEILGAGSIANGVTCQPRYGYRPLYVLLCRREAEERINHKRVWRVYRDLGLSVRRT
jgi:hypothetical protein